MSLYKLVEPKLCSSAHRKGRVLNPNFLRSLREFKEQAEDLGYTYSFVNSSYHRRGRMPSNIADMRVRYKISGLLHALNTLKVDTAMIIPYDLDITGEFGGGTFLTSIPAHGARIDRKEDAFEIYPFNHDGEIYGDFRFRLNGCWEPRSRRYGHEGMIFFDKESWDVVTLSFPDRKLRRVLPSS